MTPPIRFVFLELTNRCNFSCTFCPDGVMTRPRQTMPKALALRLLDEIASKRLAEEPIQLHVMGEPFLHPDLFEVLGFARQRGLAIRLFTNGALLHAANRERLFRAGPAELVIGVQTHTEALYHDHRRGRPDYGTYMRQIRDTIETKVVTDAATRIELHFMNTKHFNSFRADKGYHGTAWPLVDDNRKALEIIGEWTAFGREVARRHRLDWEPVDLEGLQGAYRDDPLACVRGNHCEILPGVILGFKEIGTFSDYLVRPIRFVERFRSDCRALNEQLAVLASGDCTLCCVDYDGKMAAGNAGELGIEGVWESGAVRALQRANDEGRFASEVCRVCRAFQVADDYADKFPGREAEPYGLERGWYPLERGDDGPFRWTGARAVVELRSDALRVELSVKPGHPRLGSATCQVSQGDRRRQYRLEAGRWQPLVFDTRPLASAGSRVIVETEQFWVPAELFPGDADRRELGLMVRDLSVVQRSS